MEITVITPSIGTPDLARAVESVGAQTINKKHSVRHIVVADGKKHLADVTKYAMKGWKGEGLTPRIYAIPDNTGEGGYHGSKIYAHYSQLLSCDYLFLLDEDNSYEPTHIENLLPIAHKYGFSWSKRKVYSSNGEYLGVDQGESIGQRLPQGYVLIDTSSWCFRADNINMLKYFEGTWGEDRRFTEIMLTEYGNLTKACSDYVTMNYHAPERLTDFFKQNCIL